MMKTAFTFSELFVVVAIISILVAILIPAINGAREKRDQANAEKEIEQEVIEGNVVNINPVATEGGQYIFITFKDGRVIRFFMSNSDSFQFQKGKDHRIYHVKMRIVNIAIN